MYTHLNDSLPDLEHDVLVTDGEGNYSIGYLERRDIDDLEEGDALYQWQINDCECDLEGYQYWMQIPKADLESRYLSGCYYKDEVEKIEQAIKGYRVDGSTIVKI